MKERCKAKAKAKAKANAKAKAIWTSFFGLGVFFFGFGLSFLYPSVGHFFSFAQWPRQPTWTGPNVCCVPVPVGGNAVRVGSSGQTRIRSPD